MEAKTVATKLTDEFFFRFGQLSPDQGKQLKSQLLKEVCTILRIDKKELHPTIIHNLMGWSDALIEHYSLCYLLVWIIKDPFHWEEDHLQKVCMAYNTSIQSSTNFTPFFLMFSREARLPIDIQFDLPQPSSSVTDLWLCSFPFQIT